MESESLEKFEATLQRKLSTLFKQFRQLRASAHIAPSDLALIDAFENRRAGSDDLTDAFRFLSELLHQHYGEQAVILLDEYDAPIHAACTHGFHDPLIAFMKKLMGSALKDNRHLHKAVLTGVLRVSKEDMLSGLNNLDVYTVLDDEYSEHFGFTTEEVSGLLGAARLKEKKPDIESEIKAWYNGYRFGNHVIYNPWSIVSCIHRKGALKTYWANTSGSALLKKLLAQADAKFKGGLEQLLRGEPGSCG